MERDTLENALRMVAERIGGTKLRVIFHLGTAICADEVRKVIKVPRAAMQSGLTKDAISLLRANIYHESGHIGFTKFSKGKRRPKGVLFKITNALEDPRMEREVAANWPGTREILRWSNEYYNKKIALQIASGKLEKPLWEVLAACNLLVSGIQPAWRLTPQAQKYFDLIYDKFAEIRQAKNTDDSLALAKEIYAILKDEFEKNKQAEKESEGDDQKEEKKNDKNEKPENNEDENTDDAENEDDSGENDEDVENEDGGEDENGEKSEGKDDFSDENDGGDDENDGGDDTENEDDSGDDELGDEEDGENEDDGRDEDDGGDEEDGENEEDGGDDEGDGGEDYEDYDEDAEDDDENGENEDGGEDEDLNGNKAEDENGEDDEKGDGETDKGGKNNGDDGGSNFEDDLDDESDGKTKSEILNDALESEIANSDFSDFEYIPNRMEDVHNVPESNPTKYMNEYQAISANVAIVSRILEQSLRSISRNHREGFHRRGKLDLTRLTQIATNTSREVFYQLRSGQALNTAVSIVVDESGSMYDVMDQVRLVVMALSEAMNNVKIPFSIMGGTTKYCGDYGGKLKDFSRVNPIIYNHYKDFAEKWFAVRSRVASMNEQKSYVDGEVIEYVTKTLLERSECRKVIISISDGCPHAGYDSDNDVLLGNNLRRVCEASRKAGVEVYSISIGTMLPSLYYGKKWSFEIDADEKFGCDFASRLSQIISGGRFQK